MWRKYGVKGGMERSVATSIPICIKNRANIVVYVYIKDSIMSQRMWLFELVFIHVVCKSHGNCYVNFNCFHVLTYYVNVRLWLHEMLKVESRVRFSPRVALEFYNF